MNLFGRSYECPKSYTAGTHRSRSPAATLAEYGAAMDRFGITRLANVTGLDCVGIPVYMAVRPNSRALTVSQGKGIDADAAKASALMESIENWHGERMRNPLRHESYNAMKRAGSVVELEGLPIRSGVKLAGDRPLLWVEGWDLLQDRACWAPYEFVSMNSVQPVGTTLTFALSSNGLASGNHLLEAVEHALCEVIERDALALANLSGDRGFAERKVDAGSIDDAVGRDLLEKLAQAGLEAAIWDLTSDLGIPTFAAAIAEKDRVVRWREIGVLWGSGTHLDASIALSRAITEAAQSRVTFIAGSRDDVFRRDYVQQTDRARAESLVAKHFRCAPARSYRDRCSLSTKTLDGDIDILLSSLERIGIAQVVVVDLTLPEIGIPVVKIVIPRLEFDQHPALRWEGAPRRTHLARASS